MQALQNNKFLSTPSARRATGSPNKLRGGKNISIHALREEGDTINQLRQAFQIQFLSTPSARRATKETYIIVGAEKISIHALREEGDLPGRAYGLIYNISIHALREEGDAIIGEVEL